MMLEYDKKIYGKRNAWPLTLLQYIFFPGFVITIIMIILGVLKLSITLPDIIIYTLGIYSGMIAFIGFPLVSIFKLGIKRLIVRSSVQLYEEKKHIRYEKLAQMHWTAVGHVTEFHNYFIENITEVTETRRFYWIKGDITLNVIYNGRHYKHKKVNQVKIAIAYKNMEKIYEFAGGGAAVKKRYPLKSRGYLSVNDKLRADNARGVN